MRVVAEDQQLVGGGNDGDVRVPARDPAYRRGRQRRDRARHMRSTEHVRAKRSSAVAAGQRAAAALRPGGAVHLAAAGRAPPSASSTLLPPGRRLQRPAPCCPLRPGCARAASRPRPLHRDVLNKRADYLTQGGVGGG